LDKCLVIELLGHWACDVFVFQSGIICLVAQGTRLDYSFDHDSVRSGRRY
jgi:hypothetical protein